MKGFSLTISTMKVNNISFCLPPYTQYLAQSLLNCKHPCKWVLSDGMLNEQQYKSSGFDG